MTHNEVIQNRRTLTSADRTRSLYLKEGWLWFYGQDLGLKRLTLTRKRPQTSPYKSLEIPLTSFSTYTRIMSVQSQQMIHIKEQLSGQNKAQTQTLKRLLVKAPIWQRHMKKDTWIRVIISIFIQTWYFGHITQAKYQLLLGTQYYRSVTKKQLNEWKNVDKGG